MKHPTRLAAPLLAACTFVVCYLRGFVFPCTPILLWGDQLGFATKGARMLHGDLPYRDFFEFLTPGTDLVYAALFHLTPPSPWIPNLVMACLAAITAWMLTWCAARLLTGAFVALPAILLVGFILYGSLDATHHWFSTVAIMAAVCVLFDRATTPRILIAGALIGIAATFTQTKGAAVAIGLILYLIWLSRYEKSGAPRCWQRCLFFASSVFLIFAAINGPFIAAAGVHRWFEQVVIFPVRYFGSVSINNWHGSWPEFRERSGVLKWVCFPFIYCAVPITYAAIFIAMRRKGSTVSDKPRLLLIAITGISMFAVMLPALSIRRLSCVAPPAMILLAWLLSNSRGAERETRMETSSYRIRKTIAAGLAILSLMVALAQVVVMQLRPGQRVTLPIGTVMIPDSVNAEVYRWTAAHTHPRQWYFGLSPLSLPLALRDAAPVEALGPGDYSRPEQITALIAALDLHRPPLMILLPHSDFLSRQATGADHLQPFYSYLEQHYRLIHVFPNNFQAWQLINTP